MERDLVEPAFEEVGDALQHQPEAVQAQGRQRGDQVRVGYVGNTGVTAWEEGHKVQ